MNNWMLSKVRYTKQQDNGTFKRVTEQYLFAAMSFTDTEARIFEELGSSIRGEFVVVAIARQELHDIFGYGDVGTWYTCKISFASLDADTEKSSVVKQNFLVEASSVKEATERLKESLTGFMADYEITAVVKSPILDVFPYVEVNTEADETTV